MQDALTKTKILDHQLNQLNYVLQEFIAHNKTCFSDPEVYQVETYQVRKRRCFRILKASEDQNEVKELQDTLESVIRHLDTMSKSAQELRVTRSLRSSLRRWIQGQRSMTEEIDQGVLKWCQDQMVRIQSKLDNIEKEYPKEEWIDPDL